MRTDPLRPWRGLDMHFSRAERPDGTRRVRGRVCHPHTRTRPFSPPPPPASIPAAGSKSPPDPHPAEFTRPDGYPPRRWDLAAAQLSMRGEPEEAGEGHGAAALNLAGTVREGSTASLRPASCVTHGGAALQDSMVRRRGSTGQQGAAAGSREES
jgi:hypothetical protein